MNNMLFNSAVLFSTNKVNTGSPFSVHDVTKKLRELISAGDVIISDRTPEDVDGVQTIRVSHDEVRDVFYDLFNNDLIPSIFKIKNTGAGYVLFNKSDKLNADKPLARTLLTASVDLTKVDGATDNDGCCGGNCGCAAPQAPDKNTAIIKAFSQTRNSGEVYSIKRIQSILKRKTSLICLQIAQTLKDLGYTVQMVGKYPSKWTVTF